MEGVWCVTPARLSKAEGETYHIFGAVVTMLLVGFRRSDCSDLVIKNLVLDVVEPWRLRSHAIRTFVF